jgi:hypothetical protein
MNALQIARGNEAISELDGMISRALRSGAHFEYGIRHEFTPGLYSRTVLLSKGSEVTSRVHKTEHQFVVSKGVLRVFEPDKGFRLIVAPYIGTTPAGCRRAVFCLEDTVWTTFHATACTTVEEVEGEIFA